MAMKLWLLRPIDEDPAWEPWYDKMFGCVVRAETEARARELATQEQSNETFHCADAWSSAEHSTCVELSQDGPEEFIIRDVAWA